ncbi:MAG: hypothetical protein ACREX3_25915 [Gammaproteobacteria bacterium]
MPEDLKSLVTRSIADLKNKLSQKAAELDALKRELELHESVRQMLSQDGRKGPGKTTVRSGRQTEWKAVLKGLPASFTTKDFMRTAGRNKSPVYVRQILSRLTKGRKLKRVARGKYRKV